MTPARASRLCWYPSAAQVVVDVSGQGVAHVSQVHRCGSPWSCPVCAPAVRAGRAQEVEQALGAHLAAGGGAELVTMTVPHYATAALAPRLEVICRALGLVLKGTPWERRKGRLGYLGSIRAVEITYGDNGWHPHVHAVLLFERPLRDADRVELRDWMRTRWAGIVTRKGWGRLNLRHGIDVRKVDRDGLGDYLTKVDGGWHVGAELARADMKTGKGRTPFELLYQLASTGDRHLLRLWHEYESATFGARFMVWSPGLRARFIAEPEKDDVELAAAEGSGLALVRALIEADYWRARVRAGTVGLLLDDLEDQALIVLALVRLAGHQPRPIDDGGG